MWFLFYIFLLVVIAVTILKFLKICICGRARKCIKNKHVVITGGSSGIGKAFAILAAKKGANVTIVARNKAKIESAVKEVKAACEDSSQYVSGVSLDTTDAAKVAEMFNGIENNHSGPIYMLVNCAGTATCGKLEDTPLEDFRSLMDINYFGTVYPTRFVVPLMKNRNDGIIIITGSQASLVGIYGFAAYSASKFALRGLAEALDMEVSNYDINVTLSLPPDTDTPGFENENKNKPVETKLICESGGLFDPALVAESMYEDAISGRFLSCIGFESIANATVSAGLSRASNLVDLLFEIFFMGIFRAVAFAYLQSFYRIIKRCATVKKTQ